MAKGGQKAQPTSGLSAAWAKYDAGDVVIARRLAQAFLESTPEGPLADEARDLLSRTSVSKLTWVFGGICAGLLGLLILLAIVRT